LAGPAKRNGAASAGPSRGAGPAKLASVIEASDLIRKPSKGLKSQLGTAVRTQGAAKFKLKRVSAVS
jgi:hypothetical protein